METTVLQKMLDCGVHFGHRVQKWNPKMKKYLYGQRKGIHIFDLEKTYQKLTEALSFVKKMVSEGKTILLVGTKPQALKFIAEAAAKIQMPYVSQKWIGGLLTNFATVKKRIDYLKKLKTERETGEFDKYTKKEASGLLKTINKLEAALGGVQEMSKLPDALFLIDVVRDDIAVKEARRLGISIIGIADSNADPSKIDYVIPGNDDAIKSLEFFIAVFADAVIEAKKAKKKI